MFRKLFILVFPLFILSWGEGLALDQKDESKESISNADSKLIDREVLIKYLKDTDKADLLEEDEKKASEAIEVEEKTPIIYINKKEAFLMDKKRKIESYMSYIDNRIDFAFLLFGGCFLNSV